MKKVNGWKIFSGILLIIVAVVILGDSMGFLPDAPWFAILAAGLFVIYTVRQFIRRRFFTAVMALCIAAWVMQDYLKIQDIAPFPLLFAGACLGIGLNLLFKKKKTVKVQSYVNTESKKEDAAENIYDEKVVLVKNKFNSVSKYINSDSFEEARLENQFGSVNVYFNNACMANGHSKVAIDNSFGEMNVYLPGTWRVDLNQSVVAGEVKHFGVPNADLDAPFVEITADSNFGIIKIYSE